MSPFDGVDLYQLLVQGVKDYAIYALDPRGMIVSWNEGAQRLKAYTADEVIGQHLSLFYPPEDRAVCYHALSIALAEGRFEGEGWRVRKDGTRFWANVIITRLHDASGRHIGFAKVTRDLTERRAAEERRVTDAARMASEETARRDAEANARELRELVEKLEDQMLELEQQREELMTLAEELAQTNNELQDAVTATELARKDADQARAEADSANHAKSLFLAVTSHELRTPINAIIGYTDLMADEVVGPLNDVQGRYIERVRMSARHLLALIENVLTLSRVEARRESVHVADIDVCAVARESAELLAPSAAAKGLRFEIDIPAKECRIATDATKVRQILINLLSNAVKFTDFGEIVLTLIPEADAVRIAVRDTGVGIAASALERVFEAYWRADTNRYTHRSGTGLGLSVSKRLVEVLGGTIEIESEPGVGSTFTVRLPKDGVPADPSHHSPV
jgi:PAS domain S-box-containing protein